MVTASLKNAEFPAPPVHVAIIMDGNGRWAQARGLPRTAGHQRGAKAVKRTVKAAVHEGIDYLTVFGFSSENWKRPEEEVRDLMGLLRLYLKSELAELKREGVRFRVIGDRKRLAPDINLLIEDMERETVNSTGMVLTVALSYGSRAEIAAAARHLAVEVSEGRLSVDDIDEEAIAGRLFTSDLPDPDLLIRTSGEQRISNFLLWQLAYAELVFVDKLWPDFEHEDLKDAIKEYQSRERRYGATGL